MCLFVRLYSQSWWKWKIDHMTNRPTIIFIFWGSLMLQKTFLSPQVKLCAFVTYKYGIYELPNDLRLLIISLGKWSKPHRMIA